MSSEALHIFDCDGVLVDSEVLVTRIESELLHAVGIALSPEEIAGTFVGLSDAEMHQRIESEWRVKLPAGFADEKAARLELAFDRDLEPVAGVPTLLAALDVPRCVASSSALPRIRRSLATTKLAPFFGPHVFSASMVTRGKPAPDLFELAATTMGARPAHCVVVEDSPHGVAAGRAAGMHVIGFTAGAHCGPGLAAALVAAGADEIATDSVELHDALAP